MITICHRLRNRNRVKTDYTSLIQLNIKSTAKHSAHGPDVFEIMLHIESISSY